MQDANCPLKSIGCVFNHENVSAVLSHPSSHIQSNLFNTDTEGTKLSVRIIEVEFVWNLISFGPCGLCLIERCPYYRGRVCMEFGLFRTMWTVRNREVSVL